MQLWADEEVVLISGNIIIREQYARSCNLRFIIIMTPPVVSSFLRNKVVLNR